MEEFGFGVIMVFSVVILLLSAIQIGLTIWAIVDLVKRKYVRGGNKIVWVLVILLLSTIGPILYLLLGRTEDQMPNN